MTKAEQNRVVAWRLKIIRPANELPISVAIAAAKAVPFASSARVPP
jgi:hypothetical protein